MWLLVLPADDQEVECSNLTWGRPDTSRQTKPFTVRERYQDVYLPGTIIVWMLDVLLWGDDLTSVEQRLIEDKRRRQKNKKKPQIVGPRPPMSWTNFLARKRNANRLQQP